MDNRCIIWLNFPLNTSTKIERLQNQAMRSLIKVDGKSCSQGIRSKLGLFTLYNRRRFSHSVLAFKIVLNNVNSPYQLRLYLSFRCNKHSRNLSDNTLLHLPKVRTKTGQTALQYAAAVDWNSFLKICQGNRFNTKV